MQLQPFGIHFINLKGFDKIDPNDTDNKELPDQVIARIIAPHLVDESKGSGTAPKELSYKEEKIGKLQLEHRFTARIFYCQKQTPNRFANFLVSHGANRDEHRSQTLHYIAFLSRTVKRMSSDKKAAQVWEIFALTTHDGWRVVKPHSDFSFPIRVAKRVIDPRLSEVESKMLAGHQEATSETFRERYKLSDNVLDTMWKIFKGFSSNFKPHSSAMRLSAFASERAKKGIVKVTVGPGRITIERNITIEQYCEVLCHMSKIARGKETLCEEEGKKASVKELDDPAFMHLENIQVVSRSDQRRLDGGLKQILWEIVKNPSIHYGFYFAHRYHRDFHHSTVFELTYKDNSATWNYPPTLTEIGQSLKIFYGKEAHEDPLLFAGKVNKTFVKFNYGDHGPLKLMEFIQGEFRSANETFFRIDGLWYKVQADHLDLIQQNFCALLNGGLVRSGKEEDGQLPLPWFSNEESVTFSLKDVDKEVSEAIQTLKGKIFRFVGEDGTILVPYLTRCIFSQGSTDRSYRQMVKKNWEEINAFLWQKRGKKLTAKELLDAIFKTKKKDEQEAREKQAEELFKALQREYPICIEKKASATTGAIVDEEGHPQFTDLSQFSFSADTPKSLSDNKASWSQFLSQVADEDTSALSQGIVTVQKIDDFLKTNKNMKVRVASSNILGHLQKGRRLPQQGRESYYVAGPITKDVANPKAREFLQARHEEYRKVYDEEGYNRLYLGRKGYLVADQVYGDKKRAIIELFDILSFVDARKEVCVIHVKEGFGQTTRQACAQIRVSASRLEGAISSGGYDALRELYQEVTKEGNDSVFRTAAREAFRSVEYGKLKGEEAFVELFRDKKRRKQIVFVYAFIPESREDKRLEEELAPPYEFSDKDFEAKGTVKKLQALGYLDEEFKLTKQFLDEPQLAFNEKLGSGGKKIYAALRSKGIQFHSVGAKVELLQLKSFLDRLGFGFRICQIGHLAGVKGEQATEAVVEVLPAPFDSDRIIAFEGKSYIPSKEIQLFQLGAILLNIPQDSVWNLQLAFHDLINKNKDQFAVKAYLKSKKTVLADYLESLKGKRLEITEEEITLIAKLQKQRVVILRLPQKISFQPRELTSEGTLCVFATEENKYFCCDSPKESAAEETKEDDASFIFDEEGNDGSSIHQLQGEDPIFSQFTETFSKEERDLIVADHGSSGIYNSGSDCFMIATLQMIMRSSLLEFLRNADNLSNEDDAFYKALEGFFTKYSLESKQGKPNPWELRLGTIRTLAHLPPGQQDASDFLMQIFSEYNLEPISPKYRELSFVDFKNMAPSSGKDLSKLMHYKNTDRYFVENINFSSETMVILQIPDRKPAAFKTLIEYWENTPEDAEIKFTCQDIVYKAPKTKTERQIQSLPDGLFFKIVRYDNQKHIFNAEIDFGDGTFIWQNKTYALAGFVEHLPGLEMTIDSGHYVAYCKTNDQWERFDDAREPEEISNKKALAVAKKAYLFYFQALQDTD